MATRGCGKVVSVIHFLQLIPGNEVEDTYLVWRQSQSMRPFPRLNQVTKATAQILVLEQSVLPVGKASVT